MSLECLPGCKREQHGGGRCTTNECLRPGCLHYKCRCRPLAPLLALAWLDPAHPPLLALLALSSPPVPPPVPPAFLCRPPLSLSARQGNTCSRPLFRSTRPAHQSTISSPVSSLFWKNGPLPRPSFPSLPGLLATSLTQDARLNAPAGESSFPSSLLQPLLTLIFIDGRRLWTVPTGTCDSLLVSLSTTAFSLALSSRRLSLRLAGPTVFHPR